MTCTGSKDNISAVVVRLPGAFIGVSSGVSRDHKRMTLSSKDSVNDSKDDGNM